METYPIASGHLQNLVEIIKALFEASFLAHWALLLLGFSEDTFTRFIASSFGHESASASHKRIIIFTQRHLIKVVWHLFAFREICSQMPNDFLLHWNGERILINRYQKLIIKVNGVFKFLHTIG